MALSAHGDTFDQIFSPRHVGCGAGSFNGMLRACGFGTFSLCVRGLAENRSRACGEERKNQNWSDGQEGSSTEGG
jgi:hypothetical protein